MARSSARVAAMQLVYENLMGGSGEDTLGQLIEFTPEGDDQQFIDQMVAGVEAHAQELDALVAKYSPARELERIARVDLCILRLALYEMQHGGDTPESIVINEAVELAKRFSEPASVRFVNGVLGAVSRGENPEDKVREQTREKRAVHIEKVDRIVIDSKKPASKAENDNLKVEETPAE